MIHFIRDVTLGEDASRIRVGSGPQVKAALRNLVIALHRLAGAENGEHRGCVPGACP